MIKNFAIIVLTSFMFISCATSSKTTNTIQPAKMEAVSVSERSNKEVSTLKNSDTKNLKTISVADSKRAPMLMKKQTVRIAK
jgi:uncharacterized protein YcfL